MMSGPGNLWAGLRNAPMFESGTYFDPGGMFDVSILSCLAKQTQKSGICFIVETEILQSTLAKHSQGSKASWVQPMSKPAIAMPSIKAFMCAVLGLEIREDATRITNELEPIIEGLMSRVLSAENPLAGYLVHLETAAIITKEKRQPFTVHRFSPFQYEAYGMNAPDVAHLLRPYTPPPAYPNPYGVPQGYPPAGYPTAQQPGPVYPPTPYPGQFPAGSGYHNNGTGGTYTPPGPVVERSPDGYYQRVNGGAWTLIPR